MDGVKRIDNDNERIFRVSRKRIKFDWKEMWESRFSTQGGVW